MSRKPRIHLPGGIYHVMLRGNGGQAIFFSDSDRQVVYSLLEEGIERFDYRVHAFCLMSNHMHFALQVGELPLSKIMQNLSFRYTRHINQQQKRMGHLFQGRYKALLVDEERYLLGLIRYIHQNPLRADLVKDLKNYPYSSHLCYLESEQKDWVYRDRVYQRFGKSKRVAIRKYAAFLDEKEEDPSLFRKGEVKPDIIGDDGFAKRALRSAEEKVQLALKWEDILQVVGAVLQVNPEVLKMLGKQRKNALARAFVALFAEEFLVAPFQKVARFFNRDIVTISEGVGRLKNRLSLDSQLKEQYETIRNQLTI